VIVTVVNVADEAIAEITGSLSSTVKTAVEAEEIFPAASMTYNLYAPAVAGARIDVAVPLAVVIVAPAENDEVPFGANHVDPPVSPPLTIVTVAPHCLSTLVANEVS
jgi:hypothetical protein